ncbi:hypothetical protein HBI13_117510 [Parastagonospora nodorum]|nr:hypothetical protein HBH51_195140 [Parastagonospora nodorum]KAH4020630.1 hypothetical protein HBI13_117510 [Parastagonospora nodorum]KAH6059168.1 hypothetical protein HBI67_174110 [Parastagonospora nodorum]
MTENSKIVVIVGQYKPETAQFFFTHTDLLKSKLTFFKIFLPNTAQATENEAGEFDGYSTYNTSLYSRQEKASLTPVFEFLTEDDFPAKPKANDDSLALYKLYALCTHIGDNPSEHVLLAAFLSMASTLRSNGSVYRPDKFAIMDAYDNTTAPDPLRMFSVDCYVYDGTSAWVYEAGENSRHPHAFLADFMSVMLERRATPDYASRLADAKYYQDKLSALEDGEEKK